MADKFLSTAIETCQKHVKNYFETHVCCAGWLISTEIQHPATIAEVSLSRHWPNDGFVEAFKMSQKLSASGPLRHLGLKHRNRSIISMVYGQNPRLDNPL